MNEKLNPRDFYRINNMRDIDNCVSCLYATNFDYNRYITCKHPDREEPYRIKNCSEWVCNKYKTNK